jgi:hypothetical protein
MGHAPLPPSAAERWIACPGSRQAEAAAPPDVSSTFAELGTYAHELFMRGLHFGLTAAALTTDPVIQHPLATALAATRKVLGSRAFMVEVRLPALTGLNAVWGTADVVGFSAAGPLDLILDLKFGEAVRIEPDVAQLAIYALLGSRCYGAAPGGVTAWIVQPRHPHENGPVRSHHYSLADLDALEAELRDAAAATLAADAPRYTGSWCRWCRAAASCPERLAAPDAVPPIESAWFL